MEKTDSTNPIYVFMDFDGVTHPWGGVEDFRCLPLIEDVLRRHEEARIIISSDWRVLFAMPKLVARFSPDLRDRVIGGSPHLVPKNGMELRGLREKEAMLWLAQHVSDVDAALWCAIDDAPGNWLTRPRLILTDFKTGFTEEDAASFDHVLTLLKENPAQLKKTPPSARHSVLERSDDEFC